MRIKLGRLAISIIATFAVSPAATAAGSDGRFIQLAEITVDPAQIGAYQDALRREIAETTRLEPGVLALYAVAHKDDPARVTMFEVYASLAAYNAHRQSASFETYKAATAHMVKSLKIIPSSPILLGGGWQKGGRP